jgi:DNA-binding LacI/PurR family transcriptional regulator
LTSFPFLLKLYRNNLKETLLPSQLLYPILNKKKSVLAAEAIERLARSLGESAKLPTFQELLRLLDISVTTLNLALNQLESRDIISRRQGSGIYVSKRLFEKRIALVFGCNIFQPGVSPFYSLLLKHCEKRAATHREQFSFYLDTPELSRSSGDSMVHRDLEEVISQGKIDGILVAQQRDQAQGKWLQQQDIPVVSLDTYPSGPRLINFDYQELIDLCVGALCERGCRTLGLLGILNEHALMFRNSAEKRGVQISERWMVYPKTEEDPPYDRHESLGRENVEDLIAQCGGKTGLPDGLVITDDVLACGACSRLEGFGVLPGTDIKIATHLNKGSDILANWKNKLTLAEIDPQEIVEAMFSILERLMADGPKTETQSPISIQARIATFSRSHPTGDEESAPKP